MKRETQIRGWLFRRVSAAYIDVYAPGNHSTAVDCINVYDYEKGEPTVEGGREALRREGRRWLRENADWLDEFRSMV